MYNKRFNDRIFRSGMLNNVRAHWVMFSMPYRILVWLSLKWCPNTFAFKDFLCVFSPIWAWCRRAYFRRNVHSMLAFTRPRGNPGLRISTHSLGPDSRFYKIKTEHRNPLLLIHPNWTYLATIPKSPAKWAVCGWKSPSATHQPRKKPYS